MTTSTAAAPAVACRTSSRALILGIVLTSQLMVMLDVTIVNIALPDIARALSLSSTGLSWVITAYTLTFGGLMLLGARAGDLIGRRRVFLIGVTVFTVASLAGGLAQDAAQLLAARGVQGLGGALAAPSALALLTTLFPEAKERARALGYYSAVSIGGSALGLLLGGALTQWASWRWVLFINVPIGVALVLSAMRVLPETPRHPGRFDLAGALLATLGSSALVYGLVRAASDGWSDGLSLGSFGAAAVLLAGFLLVESRAESPITPLRLFTDRSRATSYLARLLLSAGMMGMFFFLTQFLQDILGYSPIQSGLAFLPLTVTLFVMSQVAARILMPRFEARTLVAGGLTASTVALFWLSQLDGTSGYPHLLGSLVLFGIGNGIAFVPLTGLSLAGVAPHDAGAASGLVNVSQQVGGSLGLAVLVTVFSHAAGPGFTGLSQAPDQAGRQRLDPAMLAQAHQQFVDGATTAFVWAAGFLALTVVLVAFLVRPAREPRPVEVPVSAEA